MAELPALISSPRLRLFLISPEDAADMLAGRHQDRWHPDYPRKDDIDAASIVAKARAGNGRQPGIAREAGSHDQDGPDASAASRSGLSTWGPRHVVVDRLAVGSIGCFGPPEDGETEIGYGLVPEARGRGIATEAVELIAAEADRLGVRLRASVDPENTASLRVLAKCGFADLRGTTEDGELVMVRRPRPVGGPPA